MLMLFIHPVIFTVRREMWLILDERERIDAIDDQEGQHVQNMVGAYLSPGTTDINGRTLSISSTVLLRRPLYFVQSCAVQCL